MRLQRLPRPDQRHRQTGRLRRLDTIEDARHEEAKVAVPGNKAPAGAPTGLADTELFAVDAYRRIHQLPGRGRRTFCTRIVIRAGAGSGVPGLGVDPARRGLHSTIVDRVRGARVVLAVIGPYWLTAVGPDGRRCVDDPCDWVRRELAEAFEAGCR
jgi:hypothetical protein